MIVTITKRNQFFADKFAIFKKGDYWPLRTDTASIGWNPSMNAFVPSRLARQGQDAELVVIIAVGPFTVLMMLIRLFPINKQSGPAIIGEKSYPVKLANHRLFQYFFSQCQ
jgi:hypothetical protein